ncbi:hypothetical protein ACIPF8_19165 [Collimonas sp. NPDC087041]|uniref:hypothetical protein n=1 Tax=Collimonas sp. NPDC087041 TaxID=3363960 RepID=UPI003821A6B1
MSKPLQQTIEIMAKLYEARNASQQLHGANWVAHMSKYSVLIQQIMDGKKIDALAAATIIAKHSTSGFQQLDVLAAAVEMIEPSQVAA